MFIKDILINQKDNEKVAIEYKNRSISYSDLYNDVVYNVEKLKNKVNRFNNIGIFLPNSSDYVLAYFTICFLDKVIVPIDIRTKERQLNSIIKYCELNLIITNNQYKEKLINLLELSGIRINIFNIDNGSFSEIGDGNFAEITEDIKSYITEDIKSYITEDDVAIMLHTSGTTSNPKRVMLSHKNIISNINSNIESLNLTSKDKSLIVLPMFFGYCHTSQFLTHLLLGGSIVISDTMFTPDKFIKLIEEKECTNTTCVPSMLLLLLNSCKKNNFRLDKLRYICFGGGSMHSDKIKGLIDSLPHVGLVQTYGQTEASPRVTCLLPEDSLRKIGSVGKPIPNVEIKIVDEKNNEVEQGKIGQILIKGPNVMKGYYKNENATRRVKHNEWLCSGDLGKLDNEGYLYIVGRIKNIIINGGLNIYPEEIEELLLNYNGVKEVLVVGEKDELFGEVPIAKVVLEQNVEVSEYELIKYCSENLENYKIPSKILFLNDIEKTYTGKIKRG